MSEASNDPSGFDLGLEAKRAVVTGGAGTIGGAICRLLAAQGATVWSLDRGVCAEPGIESVIADVRSRASLERAREATGPVNILINAHGVQIRSTAMACTDEALATIFDVNVAGSWRTAQVFGSDMRSRGGAIVNIASVNGIIAAKTGAAYGVSKAALIHFTRVLALELAPAVPVNAVAPQSVRSNMTADLYADSAYVEGKTRMTPMGRLGTPEDIADIVAFLASSRTSFVTGQVWTVNGGVSLP